MGAPLAGQTALVFGTTGGIGHAVQRGLVEAGATVVSRPRPYCDVRVAHDVDATFRHVGPCDLVVYAVGKGGADWNTVLATNLTGAVHVLDAAIPLMRKQGHGRVILLGSVAGTDLDQTSPAYSTAKAALQRLAASTQLHLHHEGYHAIQITVVNPGLVDTPAAAHRPQAQRDAALKPSDVAEAIVWLASLPTRVYVPYLTLLPSMLQVPGATTLPRCAPT